MMCRTKRLLTPAEPCVMSEHPHGEDVQDIKSRCVCVCVCVCEIIAWCENSRVDGKVKNTLQHHEPANAVFLRARCQNPESTRHSEHGTRCRRSSFRSILKLRLKLVYDCMSVKHCYQYSYLQSLFSMKWCPASMVNASVAKTYTASRNAASSPLMIAARAGAHGDASVLCIVVAATAL